jgi:hypothetical protein
MEIGVGAFLWGSGGPCGCEAGFVCEGGSLGFALLEGFAIHGVSFSLYSVRFCVVVAYLLYCWGVRGVCVLQCNVLPVRRINYSMRLVVELAKHLLHGAQHSNIVKMNSLGQQLQMYVRNK